MAKHGTKPDEQRQHCSYYDALAAIGLMKGLNMIDFARDEALISALMEMELSSVRQIVERYSRSELGYPTAEKIAALADVQRPAMTLEERSLEPVSEPQR